MTKPWNLSQHLARSAVNARDWPYNAKGDGVTNDTAAIIAALRSGHAVFVPKGVYIVDTLDLPGDLDGGTNTSGMMLMGEGYGRTVFQASAPDQIIMRKQPVPGVIDNGYFGHFSLKAHAGGSTKTAFLVSGFRNCKFECVMGLSNGDGGYHSLFMVQAYPYLTYGCSWDHCGVAGQKNITRAWGTGNGGYTPNPYLANPNTCHIFNPWVYSNENMYAGIDLGNSTGWTVQGGLVEATADYSIILGSRGHIKGVWLELPNISPLVFQRSESVVSAGNVIEACFLSGFSGAINIPADCAGNTFINCSGTWTVTPANPDVCPIFIGTPMGAEPTLAQVVGTPGTLTKVEAFRAKLDGTWRLTYDFTPAVAPQSVIFKLTAPAGFPMSKLAASCCDGPNGVPRVVGVSGSDIYVTFPNTNGSRITMWVTYQ